MRVRTFGLLATLTFQLLTAAAVSAAKPSKQWAGHLTRKAFDKIEPRLQGLEPGMTLSDTGIRWTYFKIVERRQPVGVRAASDGWIGFLSGGPSGAIGGLGSLRGISRGFLYGQHVFGYLWKNATLVPRYVVVTRARRTSEAENAGLDPSVVGAGGKVDSGGKTFFYRDVIVQEVRQTRFTQPEGEGTRKQSLPPSGLKGLFDSRSSPESYARVLPKIEALKTGCHLLDAIEELGGVYITFNFGKDFFLPLDGFLGPWMKTGEYPQISVGEDQRYEIWPFGYLEGNEPRVQTALVFRNGTMVTVLEDGSREAVEAYLAGEE